MTQDPKKLPNWLRGKKKADAPPPQDAQPPQETPPPVAPPADSAPSDDAELPPWLRKDAPPPPPAPSKVRRLAPQQTEQPGGVPPWLAGMDEAKSYKIGGTELSEEYLKGGDELPDSLDSEMTFDSWMADQLESKREKDIEEEVPDLLSSITPDDSFSRAEGKQTGQLPDWFLGLEELDTNEAPDWFGGDDAGSKVAASDTMPPWINDMVEQQPEPEPVDEIGSFFDSLGGSAVAEEEESPELDWFNHPEADEEDDPDNIPGVPTDDFFTQLVSGSRSTPTRTPEPPKRSTSEVKPPPRQQIELPDIDDIDEFIPDEVKPRPAVEIPQNELDAFFDNVAAGRGATPVDDFEDPELEWIVPSEPVEELPEEPEIEIEPEPPSAAQEEDTMSWLNQLQNIVSSASRPAEPPPEEAVSFGNTKDLWNAPPAEESKAEQEPEEFAWPEASFVEEASPAPEDTQETEWLSTISPEDTSFIDETQAEAPKPPPAGRSSLLSGRLMREQQQEPPAPVPSADDEDDMPDLFGEAFPTEPVDEDALIPADEMQSGWMTDDLFNDNEPAASVEAADDDDFFSRLQNNSNANVLDEDEQDTSTQGQGQWGEQDNPLAETDFLRSLNLDEPATAATPAQNEQFSSWSDEPESEAEPAEDDFFTSLGMTDDQPVASQNEQYGQWDSSLESEAEPLEDDFFTSLGMTDDQPAAASASQNEQYGQWDSSLESEVEPLGDDFFTSLSTQAPADDAEEDVLGQWSAQQSETEPQEDDFFASLGADDDQPADEAEDAVGGWGIQQSEAERQEENFYALLGMDDEEIKTAALRNDLFEAQDDAPTSEPDSLEDDEFLATFGMIDEADNQPAQSQNDQFDQWNDEPQSEAEPAEDDFLTSLGFISDEQPAESQNEQFGQGNNESQGEAEPAEEDIFATFGNLTQDDDQGQPAAATAWQNEPYGQWNDESQADAEMPQDDDPYGLFGTNDADQGQPAAATASQNEAYGQWGTQADAEMTQDDDPYGLFGTNDADQGQPAAQNEAYGQWGTQQDDEMPQDDDPYGVFGTNDADQGQPTAQNEAYGQWGTQSDDEMPQDDDLFGAFGSVNEQPAAASEEDLFGQWGTEQNETETPKEFDPYATRDVRGELGLPTTSEDDKFGQLEAQPSEEALQEDDFFARLGLDEDDETPQATPSAEEPYGQWQSEATPQGGDFFAELGLNNADDSNDADENAQPAAQNDEFGWYDEPVDETPEAPAAAQEDDYLASLGFKDDGNAALPAGGDDIFAQWDDEAQPAVAPLDDDFFASLNPNQQPKTEQDPYAQWDTTNPADLPPSDDFFSAIGSLSEADLPDEVAAAPANASADGPAWDGQEAPSEEDFFTSLGMLSDDNDQQPTQVTPGDKNAPQTYGDVDSYLASLNIGDSDITPTTDDLYSGSDSMDIDALFSDPVMRDRPKVEAAEGETLAGANEDWLNQLQASVGEVSASAIVRQKEDRPVEELSDRLKKLRQRGEQISDEAPAQESSSLTEMLPTGSSALSAAPFIEVAPTSIEGVALTSEQQSKVEMLKALVPTDTRADSRISAIEATYDSPFMADLEDDEENIVVPAKTAEVAPARLRTRRRRQQRIRLDRVLIAAIIALAVIVPFTIRGFRVGNLPPSSFAAGSSEQKAFSQINGLKAGDLVLVGLEYGPTSAAELDGMTTALLRHILMKAAYPVIISGNPLTILRAQDLMASINGDSAFLKRISATQGLVANKDYYIIRYLPGSVIGLRAFSQDTANLILSDVQGQATGLIVRSMQDFALVTLVTDRAEDMRAYAEQIAPLTRAPLISAVSYGAAPLAEPYIHSMGGGLLVGYRDAYTYTDLLDSVSARSISQQSLRIIPTEIPTEAPLITLPGTGRSGEPGAEATAEATAEAGGGNGTTTIGTATVISRQAVNMRSGPGTTNGVIAAIPSGSVLSVLGLSDDRAWVHVVQDNGQDGWISAALLSLNVKESLRERPETHAKRQQLDPDNPTDTPAQTRTPATRVPTRAVATAVLTATLTAALTAEASAETPAGTETVIAATATLRPTATATSTATPEPTEEATVEVVVSEPLPPPSPGYRDERWYAMNLGIIASTLVITFGAVVNILRGLLRRGRRG